MSGVLQACTKLTRLVLERCIIEDKAAAADSLSRLVQLRHAHLDLMARDVPLTLAGWPHLTHLWVGHLSAEAVSQLGALTCLQEMCWQVHFDPAAASGLVFPPSLTLLHLNSQSESVAIDAALLPRVPAWLRELQLYWYEHPTSPELLLSCMARLTCLSQFVLGTCEGAGVEWPPPGPAYSALTASSSLASFEADAYFPDGVWPFVFPATRTLLHLTSLQFDRDWEEMDACWAWGAADLSHLVSCAPNLVSIGDMALQAGPHVSELHKLTALTHLSVHCGESAFDVAKGLAAITQLKSLAAVLLPDEDAVVLSAADALLPLTSLTALTAIHIAWSSAHCFTCETQAGTSSPDVWLQLLDRCAAEPNCQSAVLHSLATQLAQQRQQLSDQQQQIAGLQQQLSAQQQATAEVVAGLQAQLQQVLQRLPL